MNKNDLTCYGSSIYKAATKAEGMGYFFSAYEGCYVNMLEYSYDCEFFMSLHPDNDVDLMDAIYNVHFLQFDGCGVFGNKSDMHVRLYMYPLHVFNITLADYEGLCAESKRLKKLLEEAGKLTA